MVYWLEHPPGVREVSGSKHPGAESYQRLIKCYKLLPCWVLSKNGKEFGKYCAVHWRRAHRQETVKSLHVTEIGLSTDSAWATLARDTCIPGDFDFCGI